VSTPVQWGRKVVEALVVVGLYGAAAASLTWPAVAHLDEVIIGGGELGGWIWRQWWHLTELEALLTADLPLADRVLAILGLGRYPETGNILDVAVLAWPLQGAFGLVAGYNLQVLLVLAVNGLCGYVLARSLAAGRLVALAAGLVAVVNPVCLQDIEASGLRQVLLWWVLLLPIPLRRALDTHSAPAAALAGLLLGLSGVFYWFYGLFAGMLVVLWVLVHLVRGRRTPGPTLRGLSWVGDLALFTAVVAVPFATPYVLDEGEGVAVGRTSELPELTWGEPFPDLATLEAVPLRPSNPQENLLSSLQRGLMSSWSPDWILNPGHKRALPLAVVLLGLLPLLARSRWRDPQVAGWLLVFLVFWLGTLGPFLKPLGGQADTAVVVLLGGEAIRLPWTWMFQWIPGMARLFGPYRMGALVITASVAVLALGLLALPGGARTRRVAAVLVIVATIFQSQWRWHAEGPAGQGDDQPRFQAPLQVSAMRLPGFYEALPSAPDTGIIELPLRQQQDLICLYQRFHGRKVYRGWATDGAVPPILRQAHGGEAGARLRHLAAQDGYSPIFDAALATLSEDPFANALDEVSDDELDLALAAGGYRHVVVHERGYFLVDPQRGSALYQAAVDRLATRLGTQPTEETDVAWFDYPGNRMQGQRPARASWTASRIALHDDALPSSFRMSIFDVSDRVEGYVGDIPDIGSTAPGGQVHVHSEQPDSEDLLLVVVPGLGRDVAGPGVEAAFLDGLGQAPSVRFEAATAQTVSPFLGLGSLLTGRYASTLPLCSLLGGDPDTGPNADTTWCSKLPPEVTTLPQALATADFYTGVTVADVGQLGDSARSQEVVQQLLGWWVLGDSQPRFGVLVVPDLALVAGLGPEGARTLGRGLGDLLAQLGNHSATGVPWTLLTATTGRPAPAAPGWLTHSDLAVPLWILDPGHEGPPRTSDAVVSLLDVLPTLLTQAGAAPLAERSGRDLLDPNLSDDVPAYAEAGDGLAVRVGPWLLSFRAGLDDAVTLDPRVTQVLLAQAATETAYFRLHDVVQDPAQQDDRLLAEPELAASLREALVTLRTGAAAPPGDRLTPARLEALRQRNGGQTW
jgi:hypothetical protein